MIHGYIDAIIGEEDLQKTVARLVWSYKDIKDINENQEIKGTFVDLIAKLIGIGALGKSG